MSAGAVRQGRVFVEIGADPRKLFAALGKLNRQIGAIGKSMQQMGTRMVGVGAALTVPVAMATRRFAEFDDAIRATAAVSQATGAALQAMNDQARELGRTTSFTAVQVANLMTELGRAGFNPDEINAMTGSVLNLARATGTEAALAAQIMSSTLRQFGLGAIEASRAADVLTKAANSTNNTVEELGESLRYAGPVAKSLGMSLEETTAVLGVLGNVGIKGSMAGTALRRLSVISAASGEKLQKLFNISNADAAGNLKPLVQILDEINTATADMPVAERTARMSKAFGLLGITSATVLSKTAGGVRDLAESLKNAEGTAAQTAKEMDAGLGGSFRILYSAIEGIALAIGDALAPSLQHLSGLSIKAASAITAWVKTNQGAIVSAMKGVTAFIAIGGALVGIGGSLRLVSFALGGLTSALSLVIVPMALIIKSAMAIVAGFVAATVKIVAFTAVSLAGAAATGAAWAVANAPLIAMIGLMGGLIAAAVSTSGQFRTLGADVRAGFGRMATDAATVFGDLKAIANTTLSAITEAIAGGDMAGAMEIAMAGMLAAFARGASAIKGEMRGMQAFIFNTLDAMRSYARNPLMLFEDIRDPLVEADRRALAARQDARINQAQAAGGNDVEMASEANQRVRDLAQSIRSRRVNREQTDEVIDQATKAKTSEAIADLSGQFQALADNGRATAEQQSRFADVVKAASDRIKMREEQAKLEDDLKNAAKPPQVDVPQGDMKNQSETAGTFSSFALSGLSIGQTIQQKILDASLRTADAVEEMAADGPMVAMD